MTRTRWLGFIVGACVLAGASVGCSEWFGSDLTRVPPPDAAKADGTANDGPSEATTEGGGSEGGGGEGGADTGVDATPPPDAADAGKDSGEVDAADSAAGDADADA